MFFYTYYIKKNKRMNERKRKKERDDFIIHTYSLINTYFQEFIILVC